MKKNSGGSLNWMFIERLSGCLEGRLDHIKNFLAFLFYLNSQGFWEIPEVLFSLSLYKGIGAISLKLTQWKYRNGKIHNIISVNNCNL